MNMNLIKERSKIIAPGKCYIDITDRVFHHERPTDDPGKEFPKGCISICISASRYRDPACKLRITKCRECTGNATYDKQDHYSWPALETCISKAAEAPRPDDGCNAKKSKVTDSQYPFQFSATVRIITAFCENGFNFLCPEQGVRHSV